ncbi:MAG: hypothetical protein OXG89_03855 [bacterium]|nr:hypothetical protein [bacterium]
MTDPIQGFRVRTRALIRLMNQAQYGPYFDIGLVLQDLLLTSSIQADIDLWVDDLCMALAELPRPILEQNIKHFLEVAEGIPEQDRADLEDLLERVKEMAND